MRSVNTEHSTWQRRTASIVGIGLAAPLTAEFLQAYLTSTGDALAIVGGILFLAPLYGGAALMIREVAVRTGRGWVGILLLAAAFGVAMSGVIDLSMFGDARPDIPYWAELREPTLIRPLQISASATLGWVVGHVVMSIGAPLAVHQSLAPATRGRPLLGRWGMGVVSGAWIVVAVLIHLDGRQIYGYAPSGWQAGAVVLVVAGLVALAMTPVGRPTRHPASDRTTAAAVIVIGAIVVKIVFDCLPPTWTGVGIGTALIVTVCGALRWLSRHRRWSDREVGLLGAGAIVGGALMGFLSPVPDGVSPVAKLTQNGVLIIAAVAVAMLVSRTRDRWG